ncbi:hypothetical protein KFZ56_06715 [Virgibacillus sp. NKC19-3]|nr:hypothetical protein [Virgibacillus sp. NKC19-3]MBY7142757.1 hypothetical protein [Virgibacillus sp. NKC19-3]
MNSNIHLPGFEVFTIQKSEEVYGVNCLHVDREIKKHRCPACGTYTSNVP